MSPTRRTRPLTAADAYTPADEPPTPATTTPAGGDPGELTTDDRWVTVKEAADAADVAVGTIRKWYQGDSPEVPSELRPGPHGRQRLLPLAAVLERAELTRRRAGDDDDQATAAAPVAALPPDTLPVPLDAWQRMLDQLGNLHEAGEQLADAREAVGSFRTEAEFLRTRRAELEADRDRLRADLEAVTAERDRLRALLDESRRPRWGRR